MTRAKGKKGVINESKEGSDDDDYYGGKATKNNKVFLSQMRESVVGKNSLELMRNPDSGMLFNSAIVEEEDL